MANPHIIVKDGYKNKVVKGSQAIADLLVRQCAEKLIEHYPKYPWKVWLTSDHSILNVICPMISWYYGYVLHTKDVQEDPDLKCVILAGGEILERGRLARNSGVNLDDTPPPTEFDLGGAKRVRLVDKGKTTKVIL